MSKCKHCSNDSGEKVVGIRKEWTCPICIENPFEKFVPLKVELEEKYHDPTPGRFVYISDLSNNLAKIQEHFEERVMLDNPANTITLVAPEGVELLHGPFTGVYIDKDILDREHLLNTLDIDPHGFVKLVEPTRQTVE